MTDSKASSRKKPDRTTVWAAVVVAVIFGGIVGWKFVFGDDDEPTGLKSVHFVSAQADRFGRLERSFVDVDYAVQTGEYAETCTIDFFDKAGKRLLAGHNVAKFGGGGRIRDTKGRTRADSASYRHHQRATVFGMPQSARLHCS